MLKISVTEIFKSAELSAKVASKLDSVFGKVVQVFETEVKRNTPVQTGNLASKIIGSKTGFNQGEVSTNVEYAPYVEFGTGRMSPRAMFRKGASSAKDIGLELIKKELKED